MLMNRNTLPTFCYDMYERNAVTSISTPRVYVGEQKREIGCPAWGKERELEKKSPFSLALHSENALAVELPLKAACVGLRASATLSSRVSDKRRGLHRAPQAIFCGVKLGSGYLSWLWRRPKMATHETC